MAAKKISRGRKPLLASLAVNQNAPCAFCLREVDDEPTFGKLYTIGDINCHYFCALLSCCLIQKGSDSEGLFGFLYPDIVAEVERCKKHKCSYCGLFGANMGCCVSQCRKQFHLPCGREKDAVSLFYGNYKSYCRQHAPKQKLPEHILAVAKLREKRSKCCKVEGVMQGADGEGQEATQVCVICYEEVAGYPTPQTFWPPCCARDAWFHRTCLQRMALSAGMHYLKCPLCNDKEQFYNAVVSQGYYVPDRDAAWELEQNAFAEIYERPLRCTADECKCSNGREHDCDSGPWDIKLCILCGTSGIHAECLSTDTARFVCGVCAPAAPADLDTLASKVEAVIQAEQERERQRSVRTVMPSRMSLRRTKARIAYNEPSTSRNTTTISDNEDKDKTTHSRLDLNLKPPKRMQSHPTLQSIQNNLLSPTKIIEDSLNDKLKSIAVNIDATDVVCKVKNRLKPRPLSEKKRMVGSFLDELIEDILKENKNVSEKNSPKKRVMITIGKTPEKTNPDGAKQPKTVLPVNSPRKLPSISESEDLPTEGNDIEKNTANNMDESSNSTFELPPEFVADNLSDDSIPFFETPKNLKTVDIEKGSSLEISENGEVVNIDMVKMKETPKDSLKISVPLKNTKNLLNGDKLQKKFFDIDMESYNKQYLKEVNKDFQCNFAHKHNIKKESPVKLRFALDFAIAATKKKEMENLKRKLATPDIIPKKKVKKNKRNESKFKLSYSNTDNQIDLTLESKEKPREKRRKKNKKTKENIQVKIRFKKEQLNLKITKSERKKVKKQKSKVLKQYVLQYPIDSSPNKMIAKPDHDITPRKRNYVKLEKSPDNLVQTSIQSFFKKMPSNQ